MTIHHATTELEMEVGLPATQHWVSLDGEDWLPINRAPREDDDPADVERLFNGDGNFMPMRFARRWLTHWGAEFDQ